MVDIHLLLFNQLVNLIIWDNNGLKIEIDSRSYSNYNKNNYQNQKYLKLKKIEIRSKDHKPNRLYNLDMINLF